MLVLGILQIRANLLGTEKTYCTQVSSILSAAAPQLSPPLYSYLDDGSKVFTIDGVFCLQVEVTEFTGTHGVVLSIEFVKALKRLTPLE